MSQKSLVAGRRKSRGRGRPRPPLLCCFCGGPIKGVDGCINIADEEQPPFKSRPHVRFNEHGGREERGAWAYPGNGGYLVQGGRWSGSCLRVALSHYDCGPNETPYWIPLDRIEEDWEAHLECKRWGGSLVISGVLSATREALGVRRILLDGSIAAGGG